ncbi:MAG: PfkB family carbohydrate kinase [Clostridium sp.]|nr:PfkB family carbohydrate kinase [Clostridium sp.]
MNNCDICCIGHITLDKIITPKLTVHMPGGTAFYVAHAMASLDPSDFLLVTALADSEMKAVDDIRARGVNVCPLPSRHSVYFENKYGENQNERSQRVLAKADPFTIDSVKDINAKYFHLGTLLADDFSTDLIKFLHSKGIVSVDAQGYLREVRGQQVFPVDWPDKKDALKYIDILKVNEREAEVLTGISDPHLAAEALAEWGVKEVILTLGSMGSKIYANGVFYEIPAYEPTEVVDATGCGDTYMAGYLYMRNKGAGYEESGKFAAAMCTIKLQASGPFSATDADVRAVMARND